MEDKKLCSDPEIDTGEKDNSRRNFLKQSTLLTAIALAPGTAVKAAGMRIDEKIAEAFEKVP